jgi:nicotinate-nucleotide adenylyltransferase
LSDAQRALAVFGGTFNPVHFGHLRSALELVELLDLAELRLMPCAIPPHRSAPACAAEHRAAMVQLAVGEEPRLSCDSRELRRPGPSYSVDSLAELRAELGTTRSLCLVMGSDAVAGIHRWHRWQELLDLAHIVVMARPGWGLPHMGEAADWLQQHRAAADGRPEQSPAGRVFVQQLRPLPISSTEIRELLAVGRSARYLVPDAVLAYIQQHQLYRGADERTGQQGDNGN